MEQWNLRGRDVTGVLQYVLMLIICATAESVQHGGDNVRSPPPPPPADSRDMQYKTYSSRQTEAAGLWRCRGAEGAGGNMVSSWILKGNMVLTVRDSAGFKNKRTFVQYITSCGWFLTWRGKIDTIIYI